MTNNIDVVRAETVYRAEKVRNDFRAHAARGTGRNRRRAARNRSRPFSGIHIDHAIEDVMADLVRPSRWIPTDQERKAS